MRSSLATHHRMRPRTTLGGFAIAVIMLLAITSTSAADSVALISSRIPMRGCEVQAIQNAQVFYIDPTGQRQRQPINEVWSLSFDNLAALDDAEKAINDRDYDTARKKLLEAFVASESPMQQLWIRNRLLRVHGLLNQYAEATAHLAEIFVLDPDQYWARMEPRCEARPTTYAAAKEAMEALDRADRAVKMQAIQQTIDDLRAKVKPIFDELKASYAGPPIAEHSTVSGILKADIGKWDQQPEVIAQPEPVKPKSTEPPTAQPKPTESKPATAPPTKPVAKPSGPDAPESIAALLEAGSFEEAHARCERIAGKLDQRDVAEFLYQYGEALRGIGKPRDAAVMYMRSAVLYPASPFAGLSLIETALLYRHTFNRPETARRLLERVVQDAERAEREELATRARTLLAELNP